MKITRIETIPVRVPIKPELAIRGGRGLSHAVSPFLLVRIHTDEGLEGVGEASCTPRWSGEDQVSAAHFINTYFAPLLVGEDVATGGSPVGSRADEPSAATGAGRAVDDIKRLSAKFRSAVAGNFFTKAAVEMALWDICGKAQGKPVFELLGQRRREFVPTKWSVSGVEPAKAADIATWAVSKGFTKMKVKVGIEPART
jgi:L-alanine-DL-glutamate epimerase-like enolase superfamily enzyme